MSRTLIEYVVECIAETVDYALGRPSTSSRGRSQSRQKEQIKFTQFVTDVLRKAEVKVPTLLVSLAYINRAKPHLSIALEQWANERVFLGALITASKYVNDSTLKNVHWALCTGVFGKRDIGRIEREFLDVLDFELGIHETDILSHHDGILSLVHPHRAAAPTHAHQHSRWSTDSSETEFSSGSSATSSSPPRTPLMEVDSYVPPSKHELPVAMEVDPQPKAAPVSHHHHHHHRLSSTAMSILRSFPIPHFHHGSNPSPSSSSSLSPSSTLASSSSSSNASIPLPTHSRVATVV